MKRTAQTILITLCLAFIQTTFGQDKPNILLITLDDMNWDSPSVYGGIIPDVTPHIDALAKRGVLFKNAYVQAPNCSPSRVVIQTGLYPHQTGMRGFYYVKDNFNTLPEILKENGYFTGVLNKPADTSLSPDFAQYWDERTSIKGAAKRSAKNYADLLSGFLSKAKKRDKPFYCVVNVADPHKPFFNDVASRKKGFDKFKPSKLYGKKDVKIPAYLPKHPKIKQDVLNYYNSVKRGDDCVGEVLRALQQSSMGKNTVVILLSDHGAPFPFAKSSVYQNGIRTPLIVSWPATYTPKIDSASLVSAIDIAPSILDMVGVQPPNEFEGSSFVPVLTRKKEQLGTYVFAQFDENAGGIPRPSRTVLTKKYGYIFNPWAGGNLVFKSASASHATYKTMVKMAVEKPAVKKRLNHWKYRTLEELYDYEQDPNALNNLIDDPKYASVVKQLRAELHNHLLSTNDYVLPAFEKRTDRSFLTKWMEKEINQAATRAQTLKWKRGKNHQGGTKKNTKLYQNPSK